LFACFVAVLVIWMSFASVTRELRRDASTMLETHIVMSSLIFRLVLTLVLRLALLLVLCLISPMDLTITHMVFGSRENYFVPRRFGYGPRPHRGDHFLRRPDFSAGGSYTHFEPRHLDGPRFSCHGSCPIGSNGEVLKTIKTYSGRMVKCSISMIYLTSPSIEPSTSSHPM
jgi:hypothetical protein